MLKEERARAMLQNTPSDSWIAQNFWQIVQFLALFGATVASFVTLREAVKGIKQEQVEQCERLDAVERHANDTSRHRDPERDERRLQKIESGIDEILRELRVGSARRGRGEKI